MIVSCQTDDPFFDPIAIKFMLVTLDGKQVDRCFYANSERNYIARYKRGEDNRFVVINGEIVVEYIWGEVKIYREVWDSATIKGSFFSGGFIKYVKRLLCSLATNVNCVADVRFCRKCSTVYSNNTNLYGR